MYNSNVYIGNRGGQPIVTVTPVVGTADVRLKLPNNIFRFLGAKGKITLELTSSIATSSLPILVEVNGETKALNNITGAGLVASDVTSVIVMDVLFDKVLGTLTVTSSLV